MRRVLSVGVVLLAVLIVPSLAKADTVNFDGSSVPCCYINVTYSPFVTPEITFTNGVILDNSGWANEATTAPNLYATSDFAPLADSTLLPGFIVGTFTSGTGSNLSLDVINGVFSSGTFTLTAFDASNGVLGVTSMLLNPFTTPGSVGTLSLNVGNIDHFTVTSDQGPSHIDFAIDTVNFNSTSATPEPASLALLAAGLAGLAGLKRSRKVVS